MPPLGDLSRHMEPRWFDSDRGKAGRFDAVALCNGRRVAVVGTRIAPEGLAFISEVALRIAELPVTFTLRRRAIPSRVKIVKGEQLRAEAKLLHRYYCSFTLIDDADREAVARYVEDVPEPPGPGDPHGPLTAAAHARITERLVQLRRLAAPAPGLAPLIRVEVGPIAQHEDGRAVRVVVVHSRVRTDGAQRTFVTRFRVFGDDQIEVVGT